MTLSEKEIIILLSHWKEEKAINVVLNLPASAMPCKPFNRLCRIERIDGQKACNLEWNWRHYINLHVCCLEVQLIFSSFKEGNISLLINIKSHLGTFWLTLFLSSQIVMQASMLEQNHRKHNSLDISTHLSTPNKCENRPTSVIGQKHTPKSKDI